MPLWWDSDPLRRREVAWDEPRVSESAFQLALDGRRPGADWSPEWLGLYLYYMFKIRVKVRPMQSARDRYTTLFEVVSVT